MIYYYCPNNTRPCGGTRRIYDHVDYLNEAGIEAAVVHGEKGFRLTWYPNNTKVVYEMKEGNWVCYPEYYGLKITTMHPKMNGKKVILNLGAFFTFNNHNSNRRVEDTPYLSPHIKAVMCTSEFTKEFLEFTFKKPVTRIIPAVQDAFAFQREKQKVLFYMPRRNRDFIHNVVNILKYRGALKGWELRSVGGVLQKEAAQIMRESAMFLAAGGPEGFGLPPLEAMISGCTVVGHHGYGGIEYLTREDLPCVAVEMKDCLTAARECERMMYGWKEQGNDYLLEERKYASKMLKEKYSRENEKRDVVKFWKGLI